MNKRIGVISSLKSNKPNFAEVAEFGLSVCQLVSWNPEIWTDDLARKARSESESQNVRMTSFWAGWPGPASWNFTEGPGNLGIVPEKYRKERIEALKKAGPFAKTLGVPAVITHLGFIPENPQDPQLLATVEAVRDLAIFYKSLGLEFWFETGQETPVALLRLIQLVGTGNLGINLDPANLILYGKASPIDSLDVFGAHVRNVHAKDGLYPTDPMKLGKEVKVGQGRVRFPEFIRRLEETGFKGEYIIEREISGPQQTADIAETVKYLDGILEGTKHD